VMDRYIFTQLLMPFLFGVGAFSSIVLAVGSLLELVRQVAESGLPIIVAAKSNCAANAPVCGVFIPNVNFTSGDDDL
jgi:hypothetical protein